MNNKLIWILIIAVVLIISFFVFRSGEETQQRGGQQTPQTLENAPDSEFASLETPDDVFSEIDETLGFIE